jgi:hypothetical protein
MKTVIVASMLFIVVGLALVVNGKRSEKDYKAEMVALNKQLLELEKVNDFLDNLGSVKTSGGLKLLESSLESMPDKYKNKVATLLNLKMAKTVFLEAEELVMQAKKLQHALVEAPAKPAPIVNRDGTLSYPAPEPPPIHPLAMEKFKEALNLYEQSKVYVDRVDEESFALYYLKGEIYYRYTLFLSNAETAKELLNQTITFYKYAFRHKPADIDTVINVEILIKQAKNIGQGNDPDLRRSGFLNSGRGNYKGN